VKHTAFVTGADRGLGLALCSGLLEKGWQVFGGQYMPGWPDLSVLANRYPGDMHIVPLDVDSPESIRSATESVGSVTGHLDMLINNAGILSASADRRIREPQDYDAMQREYDINALGPLRMVEAFLPLMDCGRSKRLCFVSSEAGSIARARRTAMYGYCMSKAALNMAVRILFNDLYPGGYTFRIYHPGWMRTYIEGQKNMAAELEPEEAAARALPVFLGQREDEGRLVMVDHEGSEWPW